MTEEIRVQKSVPMIDVVTVSGGIGAERVNGKVASVREFVEGVYFGVSVEQAKEMFMSKYEGQSPVVLSTITTTQALVSLDTI